VVCSGFACYKAVAVHGCVKVTCSVIYLFPSASRRGYRKHLPAVTLVPELYPQGYFCSVYQNALSAGIDVGHH